ncbi:MAG: hypothetical protein QM731_05525 [Chitinophagaceae bacterium]
MKSIIIGCLLIIMSSTITAQTSITDAAGNKYTGAFVKTDFTGDGSCVYTDGSQYTGSWKDGIYNGTGSFTWKNRDVYKGSWQNGKPHGDGKLTAANGEVLEGQWQNGEMIKASLLLPDNRIAYTGEWKNNVYHGRGKQVIGDETYYGQFANGQRNGKGELYVQVGRNQLLYKGDFANGEIYTGQIIYPDGSYYEGQISMNLPNDRRGKMVKKINGKIVEQMMFFWRNGQRMIKGTRTYYKNEKEDISCTGLWDGDSLLLGISYYKDNKSAEGPDTYSSYFPDMKVLQKAQAKEVKAMFEMAVTATNHNDGRFAMEWLDLCDIQKYAPAKYLRGQIHCAGKFNNIRKDTAYGNRLKRESLDGLTVLAENNNEQALVLLASYAMENQQFDKSQAYAQKAAALGNTDGMIVMGLHYLYGWAVAQNEATALEWYNKAAAKGDGMAMYLLSSYYLNSVKSQENENKGLEWLKRSAAALYGNACEELGNYYSNKGNETEALHYYRLGLWLGNIGCCFQYAFLCKLDGENTVHAQRAIEHAAEYMHPEAIEFLGNAYLNGYKELDIEANHDKRPHVYFEMLADEGNEKAILMVINLYREDNRSYSKTYKSNQKAVEWLIKGEAMGYTSTMIMLADAYYNAQLGLTKNRQEAFTLYLKAAKKGTISPLLITCYKEGEGVKRDKKAAEYWEMKYAEQQRSTQ